MKKKICVIYTGGTIGMVQTKKGYEPSSYYLQENIKTIPQFYTNKMPEFTIIENNKIFDSAEISVEDWNDIAEIVRKNYENYNGFVILHGTDTMAYTASALSFILDNLEKPVILTGSQIPLSQVRSDGYNNLLNSLYICANYQINEVTLYFNNRLYRGNRTTKINSDSFNAFDSPNFNYLLKTGLNIIESANLNLDNNQQQAANKLKINRIETQCISMIYMYPSMPIELIRQTLNNNIRAAIFLTFGKGNAAINQDVVDVFKEANKREIIIVNSSQCVKGNVDMDTYASGRHFSELGMVSSGDMTKEATLTKMHFLLSQRLTYNQIKSKLTENLKGEITI